MLIQLPGTPQRPGPASATVRGRMHWVGVSRVSWDPPESRDVPFPGLRSPGSPAWAPPSPLGRPEGTGFRQPGTLVESRSVLRLKAAAARWRGRQPLGPRRLGWDAEINPSHHLFPPRLAF